MFQPIVKFLNQFYRSFLTAALSILLILSIPVKTFLSFICG